jgi:hypothetical protein
MKQKSLSKSNISTLKLTDLLRRRRATLREYIDDFGIITYEALLERCTRIGVIPPSREEFAGLNIPVVNSPAEGLVVLEPPPVIREVTGKPIDPETNEELPFFTQEDESVNSTPTTVGEGGEHVMFQKPSTKKTKKRKVELFELPEE